MVRIRLQVALARTVTPGIMPYELLLSVRAEKPNRPRQTECA